MSKKTILIILLLVSQAVIAQNQTANWFFGDYAGLSFNAGFPNPNTDGQLITFEGCSTISNKQGELLFYTDGVTVWNKNHTIMQNGDGLTGDNSSTQSAIIIPKPNSTDIYYIFTADARAGEDGLRYSEVDINGDSGLGAITQNKNILLTTPIAEKITAVESADGESIWVISHKWNSNEFVAYLVSDTGVNTTPVISAVGSVHDNEVGNNFIGYLKASPNRAKIACIKSYTNNETQIFDFNAATGVLSNPITINNYSSEIFGPYGCEFSPDSKLLYVSEIIRYETLYVSKIHQYDLTTYNQQAIINSDIIINQEEGSLGALQQALDGRIYIAKSGSSQIGVIKNPNEIGANCNYESNAISLNGRNSRLGLPPFVQSYFFATNIFENTCYGDNTSFSIDTSTIIDSISWDFGDIASGTNNTSQNLNPTHVFTSPGSYEVTISIQTQGETQLFYRTVIISQRPPVLDLDPISTCISNNNTLNLVNSIPDDIINNSNFIISFYNTIEDANNRENSITSPTEYNSPQNNEIIYIRLDNINGDCSSISELELNIVDIPVVEANQSVFICENETTTIDVGNLPLPLNNYSFLWLHSNETTSQIQVNQEGIYTVHISYASSQTPQNINNCFAERNVQVSESNAATILNIEITGTTATIYAEGLGAYEYTIDNINNSYQNSNVFTNITPGVHTAYVRDINNCGISEAKFSIIDFPSFFTPNGDTINDFWQVKGISNLFQPNSKIFIFNRFGRLITQIKPSSKGWDGTVNGIPLPQSDYWFSVTLQDGRVYKNHFTLKR
ncbi:T9SS type B sorting domain-containing protein [Lacinutrix venerupis]|uniref:PKD domain-containing protein n=1 Tax=Lacinutrix venerupis TaxID=1486034 RepID=A0AAC9PWN6_9FLAO|nr:T9SS type B sorting domain-containing protein [Lacinutrix venerupis]APX99678.1 hypothetical protein BWR22_04915 [Lacinutrix venerupis]